jgi:flagellar protein FliL
MSKDKDDKDKAAKAKPKSKKKLIIMLVAIVVALGGGGGGGYYMFAPKKVEAAPPPEPGIVVPLDAITVNLAEGHFLKVKISLQATAEVHEELDGSKALDLAVDLFSNRSAAELSSNEERNRAKKELKEKVSEAYEGEVMDVYFTLFVIQ